MGVADMASRSAPGPFLRRAARWLTPKRCCSSMTASESRLKAMDSESSAVVPKKMQASPVAAAASLAARSSAESAPVTRRHPMPASSSRGPSFSAY